MRVPVLFGVPSLGVFRAAHLEDVLHVAEGLDVVDDGRAHVEAERGGEIRRLDARIGALAFERLDQAGLLAADVGAGAAVHVDLAVEAGTLRCSLPRNPFAARASAMAFSTMMAAVGKLLADVDVGELHRPRSRRWPCPR
jgi:hypothetical protein